jgi:hypothetical protein
MGRRTLTGVIGMQKVYDNGLLRVFQAPAGPRVYLGNFRVHHWMPGVFLGSVALLGAIFDDAKKNREKYAALGLIGALLILDDLPDFLSFLQGKQ